MRRQKRDSDQRAYVKGYEAGVTGKSKSLCPNSKESIQQNWLSGWRAGREDNWSGFTGVSGIHRHPGIQA